MGRKATKSTIEEMATVDNTTVANDSLVEDVEVKKNKKVTKPLEDNDEIEMISLIPNVSYKDNKTGDMYTWDEVGHSETMTFEDIKNMHRNYKGYFNNMWLKPNDDRVIKKLGLSRIFDKYDFLMDEKNYTKKNIDSICSKISESPNGLKFSVVDKVKDMIINEKINDIVVIRKLEKLLNVDLFSIV